jgi:hypothetical protein
MITIHIVPILNELGGAIAESAGKAEHGVAERKYWEDALSMGAINALALIRKSSPNWV